MAQSYPKLAIETPSDTEIVVTRDVAAPRRIVFDCYTKPDLIRRWMLGPGGWTMPVCEVDLRVGGKWRYVWRHEDGREMGAGGLYREVAPPERLAHTELFDEDWTGGETLSTIALSEVGGKTRITNTVRYASRDGRDKALKSGMDDGMEAGYGRLDALVGELAAS